MRALLTAVIAAVATVAAQPPNTRAALDALASHVAGEGRVEERTARLVTWINTEFAWTATDYQQRTPEEIIDRRGGNCAELARVLARLLDAAHIRYRFVREINIQPASDQRQANAERKIATGGARFSVFGRRHNDHTWLEVFEPDDKQGTWIPADPAIGVVGVDDWIAARLAFVDRQKPAVAAVVPIVETMLVPVAVIASGPKEVRSSFYLVDAFDAAYGGKLHTLASWTRWQAAVRHLQPLSSGAFDGTLNLHEHADAIAEAADAYEKLRAEAGNLRLAPRGH